MFIFFSDFLILLLFFLEREKETEGGIERQRERVGEKEREDK